MRKIKELEEKIVKLEGRLFDMTGKYISMANDFNLIQKKLNEQEDFLRNTVSPFITDSLLEELGDGMDGIASVLTDLFTQELKVKTNKESKYKKNKVNNQNNKKENK